MKTKLGYIILYGSLLIVLATLFIIVGYVFKQGWEKIDLSFITTETNTQVDYVTFEGMTEENITYEYNYSSIDVTHIENDSITAINQAGEELEFDNGFKITSINGEPVATYSSDELLATLTSGESFEAKITIKEYGIWSNIVTTIMIIIIALLISLPIGVITAIYLAEYQSAGRISTLIRFSIDCLAGIPSIIFGLFGLLFFVEVLGLGISIISGTLTVCIMLLPTIIRTTEEAIVSVPVSYREASLGLGASKLQTTFRVILPAAIDGIVVAVILATGRIIGESAILVFTAGTVSQKPTSIFDSGATLTVEAYLLTKEYGDIATACAIGIVIIAIVFTLNMSAKLLAKKLKKV